MLFRRTVDAAARPPCYNTRRERALSSSNSTSRPAAFSPSIITWMSLQWLATVRLHSKLWTSVTLSCCVVAISEARGATLLKRRMRRKRKVVLRAAVPAARAPADLAARVDLAVRAALVDPVDPVGLVDHAGALVLAALAARVAPADPVALAAHVALVGPVAPVDRAAHVAAPALVAHADPAAPAVRVAPVDLVALAAPVVLAALALAPAHARVQNAHQRSASAARARPARLPACLTNRKSPRRKLKKCPHE